MGLPRIHRTSQALADLDEIWDYIANESPEAADRVVDELNSHFNLLAQYPGMGELQPMLADGHYRRSTLRNYVIYFRPVDDGIVLARVFYGARDHEALL